MQKVTVVGGNLFALALQYLGDSSQWNRIAQLNLDALGGVPDPFIQGIVTLTIPSLNPLATGGVYAD